ncbi:MAG TPA: DUF1998 domain-containing protein [Selenomonadales bacterium]|nr:DUF1998 domain-containing protein [Selenomonadales bacterium]
MSELKTQKEKIKLNSITHTVRTAQSVLQYGVGAMVDFPDQTLMTAAPEYWSNKIVKIHDERLEKALGVRYFGMPGGKDEVAFQDGISYVRFPQWYFCPKCRRFQPIPKWYAEYKRKASSKQKEKDPYMRQLRCPECRQELVAARVVVVCKKGHIDDFPWVKWVHTRNTNVNMKPNCGNPELTFETGATATAGLEGLVIKCKTCSARATLYDAFDPNVFDRLDGKRGENGAGNDTNEFICSGSEPWKHHFVECDEHPRAMLRGASSIYFPKTVSSLVIPPYSDKINKDIVDSQAYQECLVKIADYEEDERDEKIRKRIDGWAHDIAMQKSLNKTAVRGILERKFLQQLSEEDTEYRTDSIKYRAEEFDALTGAIPGIDLFSGDFVREEIDADQYEIPGIKGISLIHKIREVRAMTGFTRIEPPGSSDLGHGVFGFMPVKEPETQWYPAYEVRGEGIFLEFDEELITRWIKQHPEVDLRARELDGNYEHTLQSESSPKHVTPKFLLLHTIAHLLIRQLSFECGYSVASLRERIYCSSFEEGKAMAGIFIYTANGDSEGTLGGLVRQGYPDCLPRIFKKAIESSLMCSNDPVCISTEDGQGRDALNLASCHACTLLPETSCEEFNVFLDRGVVVGTFKNKDIGFYSAWIRKA